MIDPKPQDTLVNETLALPFLVSIFSAYHI